MKISCAIAIVALVLQGLLLHTDARLGSLDLDDEDYPAPASTSYFRDDSEFGFEENFIDNEEASDFVLESGVDDMLAEAGSETGVYLQASSGSSSQHEKRCRFPFPTACGRYYQCMKRTEGRRPICVDNNKCIPEGVKMPYMTEITENRSLAKARRYCNGYRLIKHTIPYYECL